MKTNYQRLLALTLSSGVLAAGILYAMVNQVNISIRDGQRFIESNGFPDHTPGQFPRRGNPNTLSEQTYSFHVPVNPQVAAAPTSSGMNWFGVALNGLPFEPGTAEFWNNDRGSGWNYEAISASMDLGLDEHNAHVQPNGAYHYHALPKGLVERLGGDGKKMLLVGYAADGFPIYTAYGLSDTKDLTSPLRKMKSSFRLKQGDRPGGPGGKYNGTYTEDYEYVKGSGDLDECNGRLGVTPEYPQGIYHYYITEQFPYLARQLRGTPDPSFQKRGGFGPRGPGGPRRGGPGPRKGPPGGRPPGPPPGI
jgi:hypothetical protein